MIELRDVYNAILDKNNIIGLSLVLFIKKRLNGLKGLYILIFRGVFNKL